ncbi:membrane cofactor protein-like [Apodemus sylvaticus]|uniref:membrane cofactor protein-like n=1 Tax=Apodemus sylvaticus TaxID=10129 RepID=UPI002242FF3C|nr:membrane cofactor protein-like [Apodemus sylvaticus]
MPCQYPPDPFSAQCFLVTLLVALLSTSSDACDQPPAFGSMKLNGNPKTSYGTGEQVEYSCRPGYIPQFRHIYSSCGADGQWSPISKDACYKKSCPSQGDPVNGHVNLLNGTSEYGSQIEYVCNRGFYIIGQRILRCILKGSDVEWSDEAPVCSKILCTPPPNIENGEFSPNHNDVFEYQEVATYKCNQVSGKDKLSLVGESKIYCSENRSWSANPPECKVVKCPYPVIKNGKQTSGFSKKYSYKATITFECNWGLYLHGSDMVVCEGNNTWHPPIPVCLSQPPPSSPRPLTPRPPTPRPTSSSSTDVSPSNKETSLDFGDSNGWIISLIIMTLLKL